MRLPPFFKDLPNEAVKRVVDLLNQPQLVQTVKDAAQQIGISTEWGASQVQDSMRQAKRWLDSINTRWTATAPASAVPVINATGLVFCNELTNQPTDSAANAAYASFFAGCVDESAIRSAVEKKLCELTGAESALLVTNIATAIQYTAMHPTCQQGVVLPRRCGIRLPDGGDVLAILRRLVTVHEVGAVNALSLDDFRLPNLSQDGFQRTGVLQIFPAHGDQALEDPADSDSLVNQVQALALERKQSTVEVHYAGSLVDIRQMIPNACSIQDRVSAGVDAVVIPGDMLLGGVRCGIVVGKAAMVEPMRELARLFGGLASPLVVNMMLGTLEANQDLDSWSQSSIGEVLTCSLENQMQRAKRIATQLEGSPVVQTAVVTEQRCALGGSVWSDFAMATAMIELVPQESVEVLLKHLDKFKRRILVRSNKNAVQLYMRAIDPADDREIVHAFCDPEC